MRLEIIFTAPNPSPELVINAVMGSIDNLLTPLDIDLKQDCKHCEDSKHWSVEIYDLMPGNISSFIRTAVNLKDNYKVHYTRKSVTNIYTELSSRGLAHDFYLNLDKGFLTCFTYFWELYLDKELEEKEKLLKDIITI